MSQRTLQDTIISSRRALRKLTRCTPTTSDVDPVVVLPSTDDIVREASAGSVRDSVVEVRTNHTGAALNHVCRSVYRLAVQRRTSIGVERPLGVFVTMAMIRNVNVLNAWDFGAALTSTGRNHCLRQRFVCLYK